MASESELNAGIEDGVRRRDFINIAAVSFAGVGAVAVVLPLVNQMNPSADVQALSSIFVDISSVEPGTQLTVKYLGKPVFIRRRTQEEIDDARAVDISGLIDKASENPNKPTNNC